jgi:cell division protein FtsA
MIANHMRMTGLQPLLGSGIVLTGGASQLDGLVEMGEFIFDIPLRRGYPMPVEGLKDVVKGSEFATSIGILQYAFEQKKDLYNFESESMVTSVITESVGDLSNKVKKFFSDLF